MKVYTCHDFYNQRERSIRKFIRSNGLWNSGVILLFDEYYIGTDHFECRHLLDLNWNAIVMTLHTVQTRTQSARGQAEEIRETPAGRNHVRLDSFWS